MSLSMNTTSLCDADDSCLVIIDVQAKLSSAIPERVIRRLRKNTAIVMEAANQLNVPIITTAQYPKGLGPIEEFISSKLNESSVSYVKTSFSCLGAEGLLEQLEEQQKKQIILTGIEAHICVLQSALELTNKGYNVFVVTDAIASRSSANYEIALKRLEQTGVTLISTESVMFEWLRDAAHPDFKSLSKLIV